MVVDVHTPAKASVENALEVNPPQLTRGWTRAFLALLISIQVAWTVVLGYAAYRVIETIAGLL